MAQKSAMPMRHGQLVLDATMQNTLAAKFPGRHAPAGFSRDGKRKLATTTKPALTFGADKRQTKGEFGYHHGTTVEDEPLVAKLGYGKQVPIHNAMRSENPEHRGADYGPDHGGKILSQSGPGSWREEAHGVARLPKK
jgi:hypothetical protein